MTKELAKKTDQAISPAVEFRTMINQWSGELKRAVPGLGDKFVHSLIVAVNGSITKNPRLLKCDKISMVMAVLQCAQYGLLPDTPMQHCHLIPFNIYDKEKKEKVLKVQFIAGYRGLIKLMSNTGEVSSGNAYPVYSNDNFEITFGTTPGIRHSFDIKEDRGDLLGAYSVIKPNMDGADPIIDYMSVKEGNVIKDKSPGGKSAESPWNNDAGFVEMLKKSVHKRNIKYVPLSPEKAQELTGAIEADNKYETAKNTDDIKMEVPNGVDVSKMIGQDVSEPKGASDTLADKLNPDNKKEETTQPEKTPDDSGGSEKEDGYSRENLMLKTRQELTEIIDQVSTADEQLNATKFLRANKQIINKASDMNKGELTNTILLLLNGELETERI